VWLLPIVELRGDYIKYTEGWRKVQPGLNWKFLVAGKHSTWRKRMEREEGRKK
jgi:hypothetical protein